MWEKLKKVIKLIQKTGDKCIILDEQNEPIVLMDLGEYEKLNFHHSEVTNLSQEELLDKINREIAIWRETNQEKEEANTLALDFSEKISDNKANLIEKQQKILEDNSKEKENDNPPFEPEGQVNSLNQVEDNDEYLVEPVE